MKERKHSFQELCTLGGGQDREMAQQLRALKGSLENWLDGVSLGRFCFYSGSAERVKVGGSRGFGELRFGEVWVL